LNGTTLMTLSDRWRRFRKSRGESCV